jgi:hypothetical protein
LQSYGTKDWISHLTWSLKRPCPSDSHRLKILYNYCLWRNYAIFYGCYPYNVSKSKTWKGFKIQIFWARSLKWNSSW